MHPVDSVRTDTVIPADAAVVVIVVLDGVVVVVVLVVVVIASPRVPLN